MFEFIVYCFSSVWVDDGAFEVQAQAQFDMGSL